MELKPFASQDVCQLDGVGGALWELVELHHRHLRFCTALHPGHLPGATSLDRPATRVLMIKGISCDAQMAQSKLQGWAMAGLASLIVLPLCLLASSHNSRATLLQGNL